MSISSIVTDPVITPVTEAIMEALGGGGGATPDFHALAPDTSNDYLMEGVLVGTGGLTTTHTSTLYAADQEGVYREALANTPVWTGGRTVKNFIAFSDDLTSASFGDNGSDATRTTTQWTLGTAGTKQKLQINSGGGSVTGETRFIVSLDIRLDSGPGGDLILGLEFGAKVTITPDGTMRRYVHSALAENTNGQIELYTLSTNGSVYTIQRVQHERNTTGNTIPNDFVPTAGTRVSKTFASTNGNTVLNNIVTEAVGTPFAEAPYLQCYPAAQNDNAYSRDLSNAVWAGAATATYNQIGLTGASNTASLLSSAGGTVEWTNSTGGFESSTTATLIVWIKKDTDQTRFPALRFGRSGVSDIVQLNTETGATNLRLTASDSTTVEVVSDGDWWKLLMQVDVAAGFNVSDRLVLRPAESTWGSSGYTSGSCIVGNAEAHFGKTIAQVRGLGPIFTTTAAVATDLTAYTADIANNAQDASAWYCEHVYLWDIDGVNSGERAGVYYSAGWDGTNTNKLELENNASIKQGSVAATRNSLVTLNADEKVKEALVYYDNSPYDIGTKTDLLNTWEEGTSNTMGSVRPSLELLKGQNPTNMPHKIRNLRRYNIASYTEGKTLIDGLMA